MVSVSREGIVEVDGRVATIETCKSIVSRCDGRGTKDGMINNIGRSSLGKLLPVRGCGHGHGQ